MRPFRSRPFRLSPARTLILLALFVGPLLCLTDCRRKERTAAPPPAESGRVASRAEGRRAPEIRPPRPADALVKIAAAEKEGRLDLDEAWTYKVQALVDPGKLPSEFRSPEGIKCGRPVLKGLAEVSGRLRPETLAEIRPYLLRPTDPESFFAGLARGQDARRSGSGFSGMLFAQEEELPPRPTKDKTHNGWVGVPCRTAPVTIWSAIGQAAAETAASTFDGRRLWAKFKQIMPFEPLSDAGAVDAEGRPDFETDGDLDIYLVPESKLASKDGGAAGWCLTIGAAQRAPTWIMIDQDLQGVDLASTLAHELFHSFQCALDSRDEIWWDEATATWSEEYIDSSWQTEQDTLPDAFDKNRFLLKTLNSEEGDHPYAAYIFPFYLAGRFGDAFIGQIWSDCSVAGPNALTAAINQISGAGLDFKEAWKEFALMNYDDTKDYARKYDETLDTMGLHWEDRVVLEDKSSSQSVELPPLSVFYFCVENRGIDPKKFPGVHFNLEDLEKEAEVSVQAVIVKKDDSHRVEDWTGKRERDFCLADQADEFKEIVVVVASTERENTLKDLNVPIELGYLVECDADWTGSLTFTADFNCQISDEGEWRKTGAWREGNTGPWQDQFTRYGLKINRRYRATATVNLALKAQAKSAESEEERELTEAMNRLFGGAVYSQEGVKGSANITYFTRTEETTAIKPPGKEPSVITSTTNASGGGPLEKYGMSALPGPRLTVFPEKGEYRLQIDFSAPDISGTSIVESSSGDSSSHPFQLETKPLFSSYQWRKEWAEPALNGTYSGDVIQGRWTSPPRPRSKTDPCPSALLENADITLQWSIRKIK